MEANRERTLVGLFVLLAAGLFLGTMIVISGGLSGGTVPHRAYFKFAGGVQAGAPVRYGGMMVGKVQRVRVDPGNTSRIEIDLLVNPRLAAGDQILAVPTLVRKFPQPIRKIIGDLSNAERVLVGLDVQPIRKGRA